MCQRSVSQNCGSEVSNPHELLLAGPRCAWRHFDVAGTSLLFFLCHSVLLLRSESRAACAANIKIIYQMRELLRSGIFRIRSLCCAALGESAELVVLPFCLVFFCSGGGGKQSVVSYDWTDSTASCASHDCQSLSVKRCCSGILVGHDMDRCLLRRPRISKAHCGRSTEGVSPAWCSEDLGHVRWRQILKQGPLIFCWASKPNWL